MGRLKTVITRGPLWIAVHSGLAVFDRWVEFVLYPIAIDAWGLWHGIGAMMLFSLVVCWLLLLFYDCVSTIDTSRIRNRALRTIVEALSDALGFESMKEAGAELANAIFEPTVIRPAREWKVRLRDETTLIIIHWLRVGWMMRYVRMITNMVYRIWAPIWNVVMRFVWEPVRRFVIAPIAKILFRFNLYRATLYLYLSFAHDGMTCLILMRPAHDHKMGLREWMLFVPSVILSCIGWGLLVGWASHTLATHAPGFYHWYMQIANHLA